MIYLISGDESYLIELKLKEIIDSNKDSLIMRFDGNSKELNVLDIVNSCNNVGLFNEKALVLVKDPYFLIKKVDESKVKELLNYCHKPIYETDLVLYTFDDLFNDKLKVYKEIASNADVIKLNKLNRKDFYIFARNLVNNAKLNISKDAIDLLINSSNYDASLLCKNLEVLALYPERIDSVVASKLITFPNEEDIFNLINALTNKKASLAIKYANKLMNNDESILRLISSIAAQLRFLYAVGYYELIGSSTKEIMSIMNVKSQYRIEKAFEALRNIDLSEIENLLSKLSDLDYKCKKDYDIDDKLKLELFIVSLLG